MQIQSRSVLRASCVPLLLLATGCAATHQAPPLSVAPHFAVSSNEAPVVAPGEPAPEAAPEAGAGPALERPDPQPWPFTSESVDPGSQPFMEPSQGSRSQTWRINRPPDHNFAFMLGVRDLNNTDWAGVDSIPNIGFTEDSKVFGKQFSVDFGMYYAASGNKYVDGTQTQASSEVWEFNLGLLKRFAPGQGVWQPYVGVGVSLARAAGTVPVSPEVRRDHDWTFGGYARGGIAVAVSEGGFVGLDFRYLGLTDVSLAGINTDINGGTASLFFGVGF